LIADSLKMCPTTFGHGSKACAVRLVFPAVTFPMHRTECDVRAGAYWVPIDGLWWQVPEKAVIRSAGNPLGEAVVWYVSLRGNIEIRCFVPADAT
jgi:hypothetical protein